jgi:hypothetical protein
MSRRTARLAMGGLLAAFCAATAGCGQNPEAASAATESELPRADAGRDLTVQAGQTVALNGSSSVDPEGESLSYSWEQIGGDVTVKFESPADRPALVFTAPAVAGDVVLEFSLIVSDGTHHSRDTLEVTVLESSAADSASALFIGAAPDRAFESCGDAHPAVLFDGDAWSGPAPLQVTLQALSTGTEDLPEDALLTWMIDEEEGESGPMSTHARLKRIFRKPGVYSIGLCLAAGGVNWGCMSAQEREMRRQLTVRPVISGRVADNGRGIGGVVVSAGSAGGATAITAQDGTFHLEVPYGWSGAVTPHHVAYSFQPPRVPLETVRTQVVNLMFKAAPRESFTQSDDLETDGEAAAVDPVACTTDAQCDDGRFCNGAERCAGGVCAAGHAACPGQLCSEAEDACVTLECSGHGDCDDGVFCNGAERCSGQECTAGADPCPGRTCREEDRRCVDCTRDQDCSDGLFCNGEEVCVSGVCLPGGGPCSAGSSCDEQARRCFECQTDGDCDDGVFCNGSEICAQQRCAAGEAPCSPQQVCDEGGNSCQQTGPRVASLTLIDAASDAPAAGHDPLADGSTLQPGAWPAVNIRANTEPSTVGSVRFELRRNGTVIRMHVENNPPYALFGNSGGDYAPWPDGGPTAGSTYRVKATPHSAPGGGGTAGVPLELTFTIGPSGCSSAADCADGVFCNGAEICQAGACAAGTPPCGAGQACNEQTETCAGGCTSSADCNDGLFCTGTETCQQGQCVSGGSPCPAGQYCIESADSCQAGSWTPPVGIPAPDFGIEEQAPPYNPANPLHHYVDKSHPAATNTNNPRGSPSLPRTTIPMDLPPGAVVEVHGGPYDYTSLANKLYVSGNGTAAQPIFIRGAGSSSRPVFAKDIFVKGSYIVLEHLFFDNHGVELRPVSGGLHHVAVRHCEFAGNGQASGGGTIKVVGNPSVVRDVVLFDNHIHDNGDDTPAAPELGRHGILVSYNTERVWIVDNHIHDNGEDAVQVNFHGNVSPKVPARYVYIGRNVMHGDRENAVDLKICRDVVLSQNVMYDYEPTPTSSGEVLVIHTDQPTAEYPRPENVWVVNNHMSNATLGAVVTGGSEIYLIGNVITGIHHAPGAYDPASIYSGGVAIHARNSGPVYAVHNTVLDCDAAVGANAGVQLWGNILADIAEPEAFHLNVIDATAVTADRDLFHQSAGGARIRWGGSNLSFGGLQASTGLEAHGLEADPLLHNAPVDVALQAGSPAIDAAGPLHPAFSTFSNRYGRSIAVDFSGAPRVQGPAPDAGAVEN